jgi:predicted DNA-binding transcriptional regulator AlpA
MSARFDEYGNSRRYVRTDEAARIVGLSRSTLEKMRVRGDGPIHRKAGPRVVVYALDDLDAWLASRCRRSTSDPGSRPVRS